MKKILYCILFFIAVSCVVKKPPAPDPPPAPPTPDENVLSYMFDAKDQYIGAVLEKSSDGLFIKVRSSKGYWAVITDYLSESSEGIYFSTLNADNNPYLYTSQKNNDSFDPNLLRISNDIDHPDRFYTRARIYTADNSLMVYHFLGTQGKSEGSATLGFYLDLPGTSHTDENALDTIFVGSDNVVAITVTNPIKIYSTTDADEAFQKTGFPKVIDESASLQFLSFDEAIIKDGFPESERYWKGWPTS